LSQDTNYQAVFANTPRFIPSFSAIFSRKQQPLKS
jgi:methyltransferase